MQPGIGGPGEPACVVGCSECENLGLEAPDVPEVPTGGWSQSHQQTLDAGDDGSEQAPGIGRMGSGRRDARRETRPRSRPPAPISASSQTCQRTPIDSSKSRKAPEPTRAHRPITEIGCGRVEYRRYHRQTPQPTQKGNTGPVRLDTVVTLPCRSARARGRPGARQRASLTEAPFMPTDNPPVAPSGSGQYSGRVQSRSGRSQLTS